MPITLPKLPYAMDALEPSISAHTLQEHHGSHHKAYVDKTNKLLAETKMADWPLEEIVKATGTGGRKTPLYNNAAQAWNHEFLWKSMKPRGGGNPKGKLADAIAAAFGDFETFGKAFKDAAVKHFGSGWTWLVIDGGKLMIVPTHDADTPIAFDQVPLLTLDVWEHAYYLDYQHRRDAYVTAFLDKICNWDFAQQNYDQAMKHRAAA